MRLSGGEMDCDDETVAVTDQMDLRAKPAPGTSQRMVRRLLHLRRLWPAQLLGAARVFFFAPAAALLARMTEPSIHQRS